MSRNNPCTLCNTFCFLTEWFNYARICKPCRETIDALHKLRDSGDTAARFLYYKAEDKVRGMKSVPTEHPAIVYARENW